MGLVWSSFLLGRMIRSTCISDPQPRSQPAFGPIDQLQAAAMAQRHRAHLRQPQADAASAAVARGVQTLKGLHQTLHLVISNTWPPVIDIQHPAAIDALQI